MGGYIQNYGSATPLLGRMLADAIMYSDTDVVALAFAIDDLDSFENITVHVRVFQMDSQHFSMQLLITPSERQWLETIHYRLGSSIPIVLVGCKSDLRRDIRDAITDAQIEHVMSHFVCYVECSARLGLGVDMVFEEAARACVEAQRRKGNRPGCIMC